MFKKSQKKIFPPVGMFSTTFKNIPTERKLFDGNEYTMSSIIPGKQYVLNLMSLRSLNFGKIIMNSIEMEVENRNDESGAPKKGIYNRNNSIPLPSVHLFTYRPY
jgi:hypothetical protein